MELTSKQQKKITAIGDKFDLRFLLLYGSRAQDRDKPGSDLDLAVMGNTALSFETLLDIHRDLVEVFGDSSQRELDLKSIHDADVLLRFEIFRQAQLLYGDKTDFDEFCLYVYKDYMDSQSLFRLQDILINKNLNKHHG